MRISDWSSDVCSSDLPAQRRDLALIDDDILARDARLQRLAEHALGHQQPGRLAVLAGREHLADFGAADDILDHQRSKLARHRRLHRVGEVVDDIVILKLNAAALGNLARLGVRSEEHTSELQSLMRLSYAVFCLKKKKIY